MSYTTGTPFSCPSCNRLLTFRSDQTGWLVCPHCRELVVKDADGHQRHQVTAMPEDLTPLQIGTGGGIDLQPFEIIGRLRLQYEDGYLNLWFLHTSGQVMSWLAESFGQYTLCKSAIIPTLYDRLLREEVGENIHLSARESFTIDHMQTCIDWDREGELPAFRNEVRFSKHFEMSTPNRDYAFAWQNRADEAMVVVGRTYPFEHFCFTNLRPLNEWI